MTILDTILQQKEKEVAELLEMKDPAVSREYKPRPSLLQILQETDHLQIIAEIKRASPSRGEIRTAVDPVYQARQYEEAGAACISVLTDSKFFSGSYDDLTAAAEAVGIPVLCKDFIIHPVQIDRAKTAGASVILLIAAALPDAELTAMFKYAESLGLEVLMEVHSGQELTRALGTGARLIGVNNRDLRTFEVDLIQTEKITEVFPFGGQQVLISESGILGPDEAGRAAAAGASGILVGEALMKSPDPGQMLRALQVQRKEDL